MTRLRNLGGFLEISWFKGVTQCFRFAEDGWQVNALTGLVFYCKY